jgi:hypothetical protein
MPASYVNEFTEAMVKLEKGKTDRGAREEPVWLARDPPGRELLAPARDADIGIEAINHGADAVYIGGPAFGARASKRGNDVPTSSAWRARAPLQRRIFVTLNTILRDDELEPRAAGLAAVRRRRRRADHPGHGPAGARPAADPAARQHPDRHPHARKSALSCRTWASRRSCWRAS